MKKQTEYIHTRQCYTPVKKESTTDQCNKHARLKHTVSPKAAKTVYTIGFYVNEILFRNSVLYSERKQPVVGKEKGNGGVKEWEGA